MQYARSIKNAKSINELFEIVRKIVFNFSGYKRSGIDLIISDLGYEDNFIGGFYRYHDNSITLNAGPMKSIYKSNPQIINYYVFHILLHEYIHALGVYDETRTRKIAYIISNHYFGQGHTLTELAKDMGKFFPQSKTVKRTRIITFKELIFEDFDKQISDFFNHINNLMDSFFKY